jgi:XTP/dITP diphosphohydrolase
MALISLRIFSLVLKMDMYICPMDLVFATNNAHKLEEVRTILHNQLQIKTLSDINYNTELPENKGTITGNAIQKAQTLFNETGLACFADDTGLEIDALNGNPGVDTAHYAGPDRDAVKNMNRVLSEMDGVVERSARFITVIALVNKDGVQTFEGEVKGKIAQAISGHGGFGYDPIFIPEGFDQTFAELPQTIKNEISHRARATALFANWMNQHMGI